MADDEDALTGMVRRYLPQSGDDALAELLVRLAGVPAVAVSGATAPRRRDGAPRSPATSAPASSPTSISRSSRSATISASRRRGQNLGRLPRAQQVARVDGRDVLAGQPVGKLARLFAARLVERRVGVPLEAALAVPVRLAVSNEQELRHGDLG